MLTWGKARHVDAVQVYRYVGYSLATRPLSLSLHAKVGLLE